MERAALCDKTRQSKATASLEVHHGYANLTLIDCHAHIYPPAFPMCEIGSVLDRAAANGVAHIVNVPESMSNARAILSLSRTCHGSGYHDIWEAGDDTEIAIADRVCVGGRVGIRHVDEDVEEADTCYHGDDVGEADTCYHGDDVGEAHCQAHTHSRRVQHCCGDAASCAARMLRPSVGLHPVQALQSSSDASHTSASSPTPSTWCRLTQLPPVLELLSQTADRLSCVGEIGLDFSPHVIPKGDVHMMEAARAEQSEVFRCQLSAANTHRLPVNVHSRSAGHYAIDAIIQSGVTATSAALLHAFDGRLVHAQRAERHGGFFFSVAPCIVRSPHLQALVKSLPLSCLVLESDSPALAPTAGQINEPANVLLACSEMARIKGMTAAEVARATTENATRLFPRVAGA